MNSDDNLAAVVERARSELNPKDLALADFLQSMQDRYFGLPRDVDLDYALTSLLDTVATRHEGRTHTPGKRRIITITGESNAGKSRALVQHLVRSRKLQPYIDENGNEISPLLMFDAPSPCTPRLLAVEGLRQLNVNAAPLGEGPPWEAFRAALRAHRVTVLCIDEAQHAIDVADVNTREKIANALKLTVQMPDWPLILVLSGVAPLDSFVASHDQLRERNYPIRFDPLSHNEGIDIVSEKLSEIVEHHGGLEMADDIKGEDFVPRLIHAKSREFGGIVQLIRDASEIALREGKGVVENEDFVMAYRVQSGCSPRENIFSVPNWREIDVKSASLRGGEMLKTKKTPKAREPKQLTFGERP